MAPVRTSDVVVNGIRSFVRSAGPDEADEAVVFLHGSPGSGEDFAVLLERVGETTRAIAPDLPGFGRADRPNEFDYTVEGFARYLDSLLAHLGIRKAHLFLHDFGGAWGMRWAVEHPRQVRSLVLCCIGAMPGIRWHKYARIWRIRVLGELFQLLASRRAIRMSLHAENPKPFPDAFVNRVANDSDWPNKRAQLKLYRSIDDLGVFSVEIAEQLKPHGVPTLVLWGEGDAFLPARYAAMQPDYFKEAEVHVLAGCGHWPMIDEPEQVGTLTTAFLARHIGRERSADGA